MSAKPILHTTGLTTEQKIAVSVLWNQEYPAQLIMETLTDFDRYLSGLTSAEHFLYIEEPDDILGWAFKFTRDAEKWFAVILDSSVHHKGIGSMLLNQLKQEEQKLNGWVIDHNRYKKSNLETYSSPIAFYLKNGFEVNKEIRMESPQLSAVKISWKSAKP